MKNRLIFFRLGSLLSVVTLALITGCASPSEAEALTQKNKAVVETQLPGLAATLLKEQPDPVAMGKLFAAYLQQHPEVYGMAFAPEPAGPGQPMRPSPYTYRKNGVITTIDLARPDYDYKNMAWYAKPVSEKKPVWTDPYFDKGGGDIWMVTYSLPLYFDAAKTQFYGILTDDLPCSAP
jgi:sigma-B regulation protein RsbU (phosphoserine phosphatase)